jgi:hypothetical protein
MITGECEKRIDNSHASRSRVPIQNGLQLPLRLRCMIIVGTIQLMQTLSGHPSLLRLCSNRYMYITVASTSSA